VLFTQFVDDDLGCASYVVGCEGAGVAVVVDPAYAIEQYLVEAERRGVRIVRVVETHTHADHVSGHGRFALEHGIPVSIHPAAAVDYPSDAMEDGAELDVGNVTLRCIHTPGHRPEHCCLAVIDRTRADEPWLVLTGDSLFVGEAARPDLAVGAVEGAEGLFGSLRRLLELPDGVEVYPGHVSGSLCGAGMSSKASTTIGFERRFNPALGFSELDAFVRHSASVTTPKPPHLGRIVDLNRGPFLGAPTPVPELPLAPEGTVVLDVRPVEQFMAGHATGAINVPVSGTAFATKAGFVLDPEQRVVVNAQSSAEASRAIRGLRSVGFLALDGVVLGGGTERMESVAFDDLDGLADAGAAIVDVREPDELETGTIPGSVNLPYRLLVTEPLDLPTDRPVLTVCETGPRAAVAASILLARGYDARPVLDGGMVDFRARAAAARPVS
jgi:glyoxylase-like metal-dependent hydrolase (beta-lactamase superfamily II)/rhodanese-related sulfurtransferase